MNTKSALTGILVIVLLIFFTPRAAVEKQAPPGCYTNSSYSLLVCWSGTLGWATGGKTTVYYDGGKYATYYIPGTAVILSEATENPAVAEIYWRTVKTLPGDRYVVTSSWQTWTLHKGKTDYTISSGVFTLTNTLTAYTSTTFPFSEQPLTVVMGTVLKDAGTVVTIPDPTDYNVAVNVAYAKYVILNSPKLTFTTEPIDYWLRLLEYDARYGTTVLMPWQFVKTRKGVCLEFALFYEAYFISDTFTFVAVKIEGYPYGHTAVIHDSRVYENLNAGYYGEEKMRSWLYSYGKTLTFYYIVFDHGTLVDLYSRTYTARQNKTDLK